MPPELFDIVPGRCCHLISTEIFSNIGCVCKADPVGNRTLAGRGFKALGMSDDLVGHETAVAATGHT